MIVAYLDPQLASRLDPSDVLQEALTCAAVRLPKYLENPPIAFYPWLRQIVREQLIVAHRKHVQAERRSVLKEEPFSFEFRDESALQLANQFAGQGSSPSQKASLRELQRKVRSALRQLEEGDRELMLMRFVEQLKLGEIGDALGMSESAVKSRMARVLNKLAQLVQTNG
jgi:RNA polymerase sigma-70 factor (ECF subfamily)